MKKLLIILILCFILIAIVSICVGRYFVNFALKPHKLELPDSEIDLDSFQLLNNERIKDSKILKAGYEKLTLVSDDNLQLVGNLYRNEGSHKYVILVHGYTSQKEHMLSYGAFFYDWGFNVLVTDNRAHGESEGSWIGMGYPDSRDQLKWINKIVEKDPEAKITMLGVSMGGATVMMVSGLELPDNVVCLIEDCGYSSTYEEFANQLKQMFHLPPEPILTWCDRAAKRIAGYSLKEASPVNHLKNAKVPMLFIHGKEDTFVSYNMLDKNIEAYAGKYYEVLRVEGAAHGMAFYKEPELYKKTVHDFVFRFM